MASINIDVLHKDIMGIKKDITFIKNILREDYELSAEAKKKFTESRKRLQSELIPQSEIEKRFL